MDEYTRIHSARTRHNRDIIKTAYIPLIPFEAVQNRDLWLNEYAPCHLQGIEFSQFLPTVVPQWALPVICFAGKCMHKKPHTKNTLVPKQKLLLICKWSKKLYTSLCLWDTFFPHMLIKGEMIITLHQNMMHNILSCIEYMRHRCAWNKILIGVQFALFFHSSPFCGTITVLLLELIFFGLL